MREQSLFFRKPLGLKELLKNHQSILNQGIPIFKILFKYKPEKKKHLQCKNIYVFISYFLFIVTSNNATHLNGK